LSSSYNGIYKGYFLWGLLALPLALPELVHESYLRKRKQRGRHSRLDAISPDWQAHAQFDLDIE
jgi:hypothetical protein